MYPLAQKTSITSSNLEIIKVKFFDKKSKKSVIWLNSTSLFLFSHHAVFYPYFPTMLLLIGTPQQHWLHPIPKPPLKVSPSAPNALFPFPPFSSSETFTSLPIFATINNVSWVWITISLCTSLSIITSSHLFSFIASAI